MSSHPNDPTRSHHPDSDLDATGAHQGAPDSTLSGSPVPQQIGPYKLLQRIGAGGMGEVWVAEQAEPVKRRVALKLIKGGVGSKEIIARFEAERQALALMNHPNIARILDAGTTPDGQPYFAMELVQGKPLTTYCDENRLSIDERLELFADVCSGVQHAHQKGIIHRDLKPGNILVTVIDDKAVPKVIDFGLAKAMESTQRLTDQSLFTGIGQILGTLKYMSPEQASLDTIDIDTRTDIYALGVILYELLTGSTPLDDSSIKGQAAFKILEFIRDKEPVKPSSKLGSSTDEHISTITSQRKTDSVRLNRVLAGDLDWIVMKALEKDRTRRYESASGFAADIRRYLNSEPVIARPPSLNYRVKKFVRKNRVGVIAASLVMLVLVGGIVATSLAMFRALQAESLAEERLHEAEREKQIAETRRLEAEQNLAYAQKGNEILGSVFTGLDPKSEYFTVAELRNALRDNLEKAVEQLEGSAIGDSLAVAEMQDTLGLSLLGLGQFSQAIKLFQQAVESRKTQLGLNHLSTITSMGNLAGGYREAGQLDKALSLFEEVLELSQAHLDADHFYRVSSLRNLASAYLEAGQLGKAMPMLEETLELSKIQFGADHSFTLGVMNNLAASYFDAGQMDQALPLWEEVYERRKVVLGSEHPETLNSMQNLAGGFLRNGQLDKALPMLEETLALKKSILGLDHPATLSSIITLASGLEANGQLDRALSLYEEGVESTKGKLGPDHHYTLAAMYGLAKGYRAAGDLDKAIPLLEETLMLSKANLGLDHPATLSSVGSLAASYRAVGDLDKALPLLEEMLTLRKKKFGPDHPDTISGMYNLGGAYLDAVQLDKAIPLLEATLERRTNQLGADHPDTLTSANRLAVAYGKAGQSEKALPLQQEVLKRMKQTLGPDHIITLNGQVNLAASYNEIGQLDKGLPLLEEAVGLMKEKLGPDHSQTLQSMNLLARGYRLAGQLDKEVSLLEEMLGLQKIKLGPEHANTLDSLFKLAVAYRALGQPDKSLPLLAELLEINKIQLGPDHPETWTSMFNLAMVYRSANRFDQSVPLFEEVLKLRASKFGRRHPDTQNTVATLGMSYKDVGRVDEAIVLLEEAFQSSKRMPQLAWVRQHLRESYLLVKQREKFDELAQADLVVARKSLAVGSPDLANALVAIGKDYLTVGDATEAKKLLTEGLQIRQQVAPDAWSTFNAQSLLGGALLLQASGLTDQAEKRELIATAEPLLIQGYEGMKQRESTIPPGGVDAIPESLDRLIELYAIMDNKEKLEEYRELSKQGSDGLEPER